MHVKTDDSKIGQNT